MRVLGRLPGDQGCPECRWPLVLVADELGALIRCSHCWYYDETVEIPWPWLVAGCPVCGGELKLGDWGGIYCRDCFHSLDRDEIESLIWISLP